MGCDLEAFPNGVIGERPTRNSEAILPRYSGVFAEQLQDFRAVVLLFVMHLWRLTIVNQSTGTSQSPDVLQSPDNIQKPDTVKTG